MHTLHLITLHAHTQRSTSTCMVVVGALVLITSKADTSADMQSEPQGPISMGDNRLSSLKQFLYTLVVYIMYNWILTLTTSLDTAFHHLNKVVINRLISWMTL